MKRDTVNYLMVGGVVIATLALLLVVLYRITGATGATEPYHSYFSQVAGLKYGTPVYFEGYRIGQVESITPEHSGAATRFKVEIGVSEGWPIPNDSIIRVASAGLLSDMFLYIDQGESSEAYAVNSEIPGRTSADVFAALGELAERIQALTDSEIEPLLQLVNERVDTITGDLQAGTPEIVERLRRIAANLEDSSASIQNLFGGENLGLVRSSLQNIDATTASAARLAEELRESRVVMNDTLDELRGIATDNRPDVRRIVNGLEVVVQDISIRLDSIAFNLDEASRNFNEFTRAIRQQPNRLLFTPDDDPVEVEQ